MTGQGSRVGDVDILLVEDNHGDIHLIEETFEDRSLPGKLHPVQTGEAALDWLHQRGEFTEAPRPDLVLLDLNLPATNGHDILEKIKSDPDLKRIPVIVLTGSRSETDIVETYERYANACLIKPVDPDEFGDLFECVSDFWVSKVVLPSPTNPADRA